MAYIPYYPGACPYRFVVDVELGGHECHNAGCSLYMCACDELDGGFPDGCPYLGYGYIGGWRFKTQYGEPPGNG